MGHALAGHYLEQTDEIHTISITGRGRALGYTISLPREERHPTTKSSLIDQLAMTLGRAERAGERRLRPVPQPQPRPLLLPGALAAMPRRRCSGVACPSLTRQSERKSIRAARLRPDSGRHLLTRRPGARDVGATLAAAYVLSVIVLALVRAVADVPTIDQVALTPSRLAEGRMWLLFTSGFVVAGPAIPQILALAALAGCLNRFGGSLLFWRSALAGHILSTLLTYAGVGVLALAHAGIANGLLDEPDYGISAVWAGALGAAAVGSFLGPPDHGRRPWLAYAAVAVIIVISAFSRGLALPEHALAFALGATVMWRSGRARTAPGTFRERTVAVTASAGV